MINLYAWWQVPDKLPTNPDCFIIPSYALKDRETPTRMTAVQIETAVAWQRRFPQAKIIFSTGDTQGLGLPDSRVMAGYARDLGLPEEAIFEEPNSANTYENLLFSRHIVAEHGFKQPALVLYDLHARRVLAIAQKMGWEDLFWISASSPDEAMALFCAYHGRQPRMDLLDQFGLGEKRRSQYHQLSTGQKRRLALALAIAHEPQVLFLDEPTAGLDVASRAALHAVMAELKGTGTTILLATHDMAEAEALCDRVAILLDGRLAATGTPLELTAAGAGLSRIAVRTTLNLLRGNHHTPPAVTLRQEKDEYVIYFSSNIGQTVPWLIDLVGKRGDELIDLRVERPSLEDRFLELTNN